MLDNPKKNYLKPVLTVHGDLAALTQGGSVRVLPRDCGDAFRCQKADIPGHIHDPSCFLLTS